MHVVIFCRSRRQHASHRSSTYVCTIDSSGSRSRIPSVRFSLGKTSTNVVSSSHHLSSVIKRQYEACPSAEAATLLPKLLDEANRRSLRISLTDFWSVLDAIAWIAWSLMISSS